MSLFTQLDEGSREHSMRVGDIVTHFANILDLDATTACQISLAAMYIVGQLSRQKSKPFLMNQY